MSHKDRYCRLTPVSSATFHVKVCGTARRVAPSAAGSVKNAWGASATVYAAALDHAPQSSSRPLVRTRTE